MYLLIYLTNVLSGLPGQTGGASSIRVPGLRVFVRVLPFGAPFPAPGFHFRRSAIHFLLKVSIFRIPVSMFLLLA